MGEYNAPGTQTAKYTIGAGEVVKSEFANENNFHYTDALGSVTSLANASNGTLSSRNEYNAFGEVATANVNNVSSANSIGYTGQRLDNETGLMALGNGERYYSPSYARFIQQDSFAGMPNVPQSLNRFSYAHNNPSKYTDPSGHIVESPWDALSLGVGVISLGYNLYQGNWGEAGVDAIGVAADLGALLLPGVPGGAGIGIRAYRAAKTTVKVLQTVDRAINVGQAIVSTYHNIEEGNYGWAAFSGALTILGVGGLRSSARELNEVLTVSDEVLEYQRVLSKSQDLLNAKNNPEALQELTQAEAKAQKADLLETLETKSSGKIIKDDFQDVIDPVIDNDVLVRAWKAKRGSTYSDDIDALSLISDKKYQWVVTPSTYKEFMNVNTGQASRRRFLRGFDNVEILSGSKAMKLREGTRFNEVFDELEKQSNLTRPRDLITGKPGLGERSRIVSGKKVHTNFGDQINAAFAEQLGIPYVTADRKFLGFLANNGKKANVNAFHYQSPPTN